jgi:hypothetical protein
VIGLLLATAAIPVQAYAAPSLVLYSGYFSGFPVADIGLLMEHHDNIYHGEMEINARGLLGFFLQWEGGVLAKGTISEDGHFNPRLYQTHWADPSKHGTAEVLFDAQSGEASSMWDEKPDIDTSAENRRNVIDPVTVLFVIQNALNKGQHEPFDLRSYDGHHRADVHVTILPATEQPLWRHKFKVIPVTTTYSPISGFNRYQMQAWPRSKSTLLFSDDSRHTLLQMKVETPGGVAVMTIACADNDDPASACP